MPDRQIAGSAGARGGCRRPLPVRAFSGCRSPSCAERRPAICPARIAIRLTGCRSPRRSSPNSCSSRTRSSSAATAFAVSGEPGRGRLDIFPYSRLPPPNIAGLTNPRPAPPRTAPAPQPGRSGACVLIPDRHAAPAASPKDLRPEGRVAIELDLHCGHPISRGCRFTRLQSELL